MQEELLTKKNSPSCLSRGRQGGYLLGQMASTIQYLGSQSTTFASRDAGRKCYFLASCSDFPASFELVG